ncbi:hypothetical protein KL909_002114 [Ogataea angusta]|uniref:Uncharacterized protein n=1 Tax=Pichia angusta TaxID=870730 RepID=A0AAN6DIN8_PICAN|nr:uncharacterized protein KL928_002009 [Ogataea angusta]KAG7819335.1 hypothetical protein KL928_002009 [Ogataea angusta]KAG7824116.1 hypothetical protein KL909_002114 [Ogataea angusta]KAG7835312.1 hypothetical protein KL943_002627 [Ogataea angusta]
MTAGNLASTRRSTEINDLYNIQVRKNFYAFTCDSNEADWQQRTRKLPNVVAQVSRSGWSPAVVAHRSDLVAAGPEHAVPSHPGPTPLALPFPLT